MTLLFKQLLAGVLKDPAVISKNSLFSQDPEMVREILSYVDSITDDDVRRLEVSDVLDSAPDAPSGAITRDFSQGCVSVNTRGFKYALSKYRDGLHSSPRRIKRRTPGVMVPVDSQDRVRYILSSPSDGVMLLDRNLEIVRSFPGMGDGPTQYSGPESAVAATIGGVEYMLIACPLRHIVQVYEYSSGVHVATIGGDGVSGVPSANDNLLSSPVAVAVDENESRLFIACRNGDAPGSDGEDNGYVVEFDLSAPATPVFARYHLVAGGLNRLNNGECESPSDLFFHAAEEVRESRLWVANGRGDVGSFGREDTTDVLTPKMVFEAMGDSYVLGPDNIDGATEADNSIDLLRGGDGVLRLYVSAARVGVVEVFRLAEDGDYALGHHEATYGYHGFEDVYPYGVQLRHQATNRDPRLTFGSIANASGVVADELNLPGDQRTSRLLVVADKQAGRLQRLNTDVYDGDNYVVYAPLSFEVPVALAGWFITDGDLPAEYATVEFREPADDETSPATPAGPWRELPRTGLLGVTMKTTSRVQVRLKVRLPRNAPVRSYRVYGLGLLFKQS